MSRDVNKWFLVQWNDGGFDVVHVRCLVNTQHEDLRPGGPLMAMMKGEQKAGILVSKGHDRSILDQILANMRADFGPGSAGGPKVEPEQEGDYSPSASDWEPSDDTASDSDEKENKKHVLNYSLNRKLYIDEKPKKRILTPSHRANAVIPQAMRKGKNNNTNKNRKRVYDGSFKTNKLSTFNHARSVITIPNVTIDVKNVIAMKNCFAYALTKVRHITSFNKANDNDSVNNLIRKEESHVAEDNENDRSHSAESNRSDDNILITNKYIKYETENKQLLRIEQSAGDEYEWAEENDQTSTHYENNASNSMTKKPNPVEIPEGEWIPIGSGKTLLHRDKFSKVKWKSYTIATRTLLLALFPRRTLATHSLTGKKSPAFQNKPAKMCLDPKIISDVIMEIQDRFNVRENLIRSIITTKCADECKMYKSRQVKRKSTSAANKENKQENNDENQNKNNETV